MADELEQTTVNTVGDDWVDMVPGPVPTGYGHQNTNISARSVGMDFSTLTVSGLSVEVEVGGPIDDFGLPFSVKTQVLLATPHPGDFFVAVVPGTTATTRSLELFQGEVTWNSELNAYTAEIASQTRRILNWQIQRGSSVGAEVTGVVRLVAPRPAGGIENKTPYPLASFIRWIDFPFYSFWKNNLHDSFATPAGFAEGSTFDGMNLITSDSITELIYVHDEVSPSIITSFASPAGFPSGLTFDGKNLISTDESLIYVHNGVSPGIIDSFAAPAVSVGLAFDGINLISTGVGLISVHNGVSASIITSFPVPAGSSSGLTFAGTNLISGDVFGIRIFIHNGVSPSIITSFAAPGSQVRGLAYVPPLLVALDPVLNRITVNGIPVNVIG